MVAPEYLDAIRKSEGYTAKPFWDYKQWTSGYGTRASGPDDVADKATHDQRFSDEIGKASSYVDSVAPNAPDGVKAALTSLTFNAGNGWANSGLGAAVRAGDYTTARDHFLQYNKAGGEFNQGLADRRAREAAWFDPNNSRLLNKMAGIDDYMYGDRPPRGALYSPPQAPQQPQQQEQPSFLQNLLMNGTGALFGVPNGEGLGSQLQNAGAGLMAINDPKALSLIAASRAKQAVTPWRVIQGKDGSLYRYNEATGQAQKVDIGPTGEHGQIPEGYEMATDTSGSRTMKPIAGSPQADKLVKQDQERKQYADVVSNDLDRVGGIVTQSPNLTTGPGGYLLQSLPGTNAHNVNKLIDGIKANIGFERLNQLRQSSPTGGALGAVSDTEQKLLQSTLGSLEQSQTKEQFMQNLSRVKQIYQQIIHGPNYNPQQAAPASGGRKSLDTFFQ
jgi:GH24 family phage-related lysozyme (muramidase)